MGRLTFQGPTKNNINLHQHCTIGSLKLKDKQTILGDSQKCKLANISIIYRLTNDNLTRQKILALSLILSLLLHGKHSLIFNYHEQAKSIYFIKIIPIFRYNNIFLQVITSCDKNDVTYIQNITSKIIDNLKKVSNAEILKTFHLVELQQYLLFDGVEKSISSFSNMELTQESISYISRIDKKTVYKEYYQIMSDFDQNQKHIMIQYFGNN